MPNLSINKIQFSNLSCGYGFEGARELKPVQNCSFNVEPNKINLIKGDNGRGKSTLLKALLGEVPDLGGKVEIHKTGLVRDHEEVALAGFSDKIKPVFYLPQRVQGLFPVRTSVHTVINHWAKLGRKIKNNKNGLDKLYGDLSVPNLNVEQFVAEISWRHCEFLSGGEAQILAVILGHVSEATFIMMDEPTAAVSVDNKPVIKELIKKFKSSGDGKFIFIATHDTALDDLGDLTINL